MAGFCLTTSVLLWWARMYRRAYVLGLGSHNAWAFASAIFLMVSIGFIRPVLMGHWSEAVPFGTACLGVCGGAAGCSRMFDTVWMS